jgi:general secretion pathway protein G
MEANTVNGKYGFTLIELIIVITIIGILAAIAVPVMREAPIRAKEAALKENLFTIRSCIDQYYADRQTYPSSLEDLVSKGYIRKIPIDPITGKADWTLVYAEEEAFEGAEETVQGIIDVHSSSNKTALDGSSYSEW